MDKNKKPRRRLNGSGSRLKGAAKKIIPARNAHSIAIAGGKKTKAVKTSIRKKGIKVLKAALLPKRPVRKKGTELKRVPHNPIIGPTDHVWESKATFNPTAFHHDGKVHIIYRAIGESDNSVLGYAGSSDGLTISETLSNPIYFHFMRKNKGERSVLYGSGGGWGGGCEDPRVTRIGNTVYMLYTAFDGWGSVRIALTSISLEDFIAKRFNWKEPVLISPPGQIHKNWVLFPEKIKGKYAILHSISPKIMIDYFKSLDELDGTNFIHSIHQGSPLWSARDRLMRGAGPAPLLTKYGWLVLYHKMEKHDSHRYKLWAMILDSEDPAKILYNSSGPILEPDVWYENEGYKGGVVYSCGAVIKDGQLFVYYGGADKVSCVATARLDAFLEGLVRSNMPGMRRSKLK